jgi:hypothetical protein
MATVVTSDLDLTDPPQTRNTSPTWKNWLWLAVPGTVLVLYCLRGTIASWFSPDSQLLFQAFVPLGTLLLAWSRRVEWQTTSEELATLFPDPKNPRRSGNLGLVIAGGMLLLVAQLMALPLLTSVSLWLLLSGTLYYIFGPFLVRVMLMPLFFLLTMTPPPVGFFQGIVGQFQLIGAAMTSGVLELFGIKTRVQGIFLTIYGSGHNTVVTPTLGGVGIFCFVLLSTLCYLLWHRVSFLKSVLVLLISAFITCIGNLLRLVTLGALPRLSLSFAEIIEGPLAFAPTLLTVSGILAVSYRLSKKLLKNRVQPREIVL